MKRNSVPCCAILLIACACSAVRASDKESVAAWVNESPIDEVQVAASHIQHNKDPLSKCYPMGAIIIALQRIKYFIDNTDSLHPNLMMQLPGRLPQVYAENIEDLQFEYTMKNGMVVDVPAIVNDIRQVRVLMTARTGNPDPEFPDDPYRRRQYTSRVNLRNFDI